MSFFTVVFKNYSIAQAIRAEIEQIIIFFCGPLPGFFGYLFRFIIYKCLFKKVDLFPIIYPGVRFIFFNKISFGKNVLINSNSYIYGKGEIEFGDNVLVSPNCSIVSGDHEISGVDPMILQESKEQKIIIGDNVWIGANVVITGGVTIGSGCVIGAGAVVTNDTEDNYIYGGVPAKKIKKRGT